MKQKTVRFYDNSPDDMNALQILNECRKYGFNSARDMVIASINRYVKGSVTGSLEISSTDMDILADKIANRMKNMNLTTCGNDGYQEKITNENNNESYQKALDFIESL